MKRRHAALMAWRLESKSLGGSRGWLWAVALALVFTVSVYPMSIASSHQIGIDLAVALQAALLTRLGRRHWSEVYSTNWLSSLPLSRRQVSNVIVLRTLVGPMIAWTVLSGALLAIRVVLPADAHRIAASLVGVGMATLCGSLLGWFVPRRRMPPGPESAHAAIRLRAHDVPNLAALSHWVTAQTDQWLQPRAVSRLLLPAMLALPLGISGNDAVAILTLWVLAFYLCALWLALIRVGREAAAWLRPTPLSWQRLAIAIAWRPLLQQLQWTLLATVLLLALKKATHAPHA